MTSITLISAISGLDYMYVSESLNNEIVTLFMYMYLVVTNLLDIIFWNSQFAFNKPREMFHKILNKYLEL